jgi:hypothetical protein
MNNTTNGKFMVDIDGFSYFSPDGKPLPKTVSTQKNQAPADKKKESKPDKKQEA